jgi:uncharacterized heparinase superfamily protein
MTTGLLRRLRTMDGAELRFRAAAAIRARVNRARSSLRAPVWDRADLRLTPAPPHAPVRAALARRDWRAAHVGLTAHLASRPARFPLDPRTLPVRAARIRGAFPDLRATEHADRILAGRYDLLGYRDVAAGSPPDWHRDAVHGQSAPVVFWESVPYLDPACGDHKVTWEINRHQHFLALGRAHALTGDRRYYLEFVRQLGDWISANPPLTGTNWASMLELAFRSLSWIWALHFFAPAASDDDDQPWSVDLLLALDRQLTHIEQNLSRYFSPNTHLTGEALALYVAGRALPELEGADRRAALGRDVLLEEAGRQVLADGGHAERSAHYHRYSTDFYLLAFNVARASGDPQAAELRAAAHRQARFLRALADNGGRLPLIGDDDGGQLFPICGRVPRDCRDTLATAAVLLDDASLAAGPAPEETYWLCGDAPALEHDQPAPPPVSVALDASGYYVSRNDRGDHLVFDCGAHGYLNGGHAHADALAIVLTIGGREFLVDSGTATYTMDPAVRDRFRSTVMHNTVLIDGRPQSEPSGPFHWRTRTDATATVWESSAERDRLAGRHSGYAPVIHEREITAVHGKGWVVVDRFTGAGSLTATAMWHIHPDWRIDRVAGTAVLLRHRDGTTAAICASAPLRQVSAGGVDAFAPEYGRIEKGLCFECVVRGTVPLPLTTVIPADGRLATVRELAPSLQGVSG